MYVKYHNGIRRSVFHKTSFVLDKWQISPLVIGENRNTGNYDRKQSAVSRHYYWKVEYVPYFGRLHNLHTSVA